MPANKWHELKKLAPAANDNTRGWGGVPVLALARYNYLTP